ncbi:uncharacterized protein LOC110700475 isoform X1 [Chenopodium quinoa]|uniref:uncharacterized protein LOC110700475 isoform X1 n=1 Tax=Chenopodium quinoa TaxID=63459 RepID=UPI000B77A42B|nr:uncharacterized protein LOC110700475 isoform X1 [Chenopodium quinoa]
MVSDSTINASIPNVSKDFGKKKRANRSAKLKQCKLDARREQWLSQVKNKNCKEEVNVPVVGGGKFNGPAIVTWKKAAQCCKVLEVDNPGVEEISHHFSDSESSPSNSPTSSISRGNDSGITYTGSSSSSSSSFSSGRGCFSGSLTEEEDGDGVGGCEDDECLDDWEAVADALVGASDANQGHNSNSNLSPGRETAEGLNFEGQLPICENVDAQLEKSKSVGVGILGRGSENCKAWRPDDAFRPQSLPNLAKQHSFPTGAERLQGFGNPWVRNNMTPRVPTSCPICCEDLDLTDSSFLPCPCGFHLCLFCHKRILEEDSRCPGCRKEYASEPVEKEASVSGGSLTIRLARSCSMSSSRV